MVGTSFYAARVCDNGGVKRITVSLSEELAATLALESKKRREPVSQLIREAIEERYLTHPPPPLPFVGLLGDLPMTPGADVEEVLEREWIDAIRGDG